MLLSSAHLLCPQKRGRSITQNLVRVHWRRITPMHSQVDPRSYSADQRRRQNHLDVSPALADQRQEDNLGSQFDTSPALAYHSQEDLEKAPARQSQQSH